MEVSYLLQDSELRLLDGHGFQFTPLRGMSRDTRDGDTKDADGTSRDRVTASVFG